MITISAIFLLASSQLCQGKITDEAANTLKPLEGPCIVWNKISYALLRFGGKFKRGRMVELTRVI
jgi:hypothetical protein